MSHPILENPDYKDYNLLHSVSATLSSSLYLKNTLTIIFELLNEHIRVHRGMLVLMDPFTQDLHIEMVYGLSEEEKKIESVRIKDLNCVSNTVLKSQSPMIIPNLSERPDVCKQISFKGNPDGIAFVCLPIIIANEKIGTLKAEFTFVDQRTFHQDVKRLSIITLMIGQEVRLTRLIEKEREALKKENQDLKKELKEKYNIDNMIGNTSVMRTVYEEILQVANSNATVLIRGESGTGKELVAHAIHYNSPRAHQPFIKINCGAIPESLIESELFGYEKGAFTDAQERKIGKFEAAHGGTLFLDEIGELSPNLQVKLLRVLQEKEFERVGGITPVKVNVRIITATNRNLEKEMEEKRFRQDLYYRLNVFPIYLPPLRERKSDILLLGEHFLDKFAKENNKQIKRISSLAIDLLHSYHWPGNVRELENCMEHAVLRCNSDTIQVSHLPPSLQRVDSIASSPEQVQDDFSFDELTGNFEKEIIMDALKKSGGNKTKAAKLLKTTPRIMSYKIKKYNIKLR